MKIAVSSERPGGLDAIVASQFGRCPVFTIVELDEKKQVVKTKVIENPGFNAQRGAGPLALQVLAKENVDVILGTHLGPNASQAIQQMNIPVYIYPPNVTVKEAIDKYLKNELSSFSIGGGSLGEFDPQGNFMGGTGGNYVTGGANITGNATFGYGGFGRGFGKGRGKGHGRGRGFGKGQFRNTF